MLALSNGLTGNINPGQASPDQLAILKKMGEANYNSSVSPQAGIPLSPWQVAGALASKLRGSAQLNEAGNAGNASSYNAIQSGMSGTPGGAAPSSPPQQGTGFLSSLVNSIFGNGNNGSTSGNSDATAPQANGTPTQGGNNNAGGDNYAHKLIQIESGGDVNARSPGKGTYKGLGQFGPDEEAKYGLNDQNRNDPNAQLAAIAKERQDINAAFLKATGRLPTDGEAYLAHQQGMAGAPALVSNPNAPAYQVLSQFMKPEVAAQHIVANLPTNSPLRNKPVGEITAGEFANLWTSKFDGQGSGDQNIQTGSNPTPPGQPTPATPNSPQPPQQMGQQGQQPTDNGPTIPVAPAMSARQLYDVNHQLDPETAKAVMAEREREYTGKSVDTGLGTWTQLPSGERIFTPKLDIKPGEAGGIKGNTVFSQDKNGNIKTQFVSPFGTFNTSGNQNGAPSTPAAPEGGAALRGSEDVTPAAPNTQGGNASSNPSLGAPSGGMFDMASRLNDFQSKLDAAKAATTTHAVDTAKNYDEKAKDIETAGAAAQDDLSALAQQKAILSNPKFDSGFGTGLTADVGRAAHYMGYDTDAYKTAQLQELYDKANAGLKLKSLKSTLSGLGQLRVAELNMVNTAQGGLSNTPTTLRAINDITTKMTQRVSDVANLAREYKAQYGNLDAGFDKYVAQYKEQNPLFSDDEIQHYKTLFNEAPKGQKQQQTTEKSSKPTYDPITKKWQ